MKVTTDIPDARVRDLLCCGMEGGIGYWSQVKPLYPDGKCRGDYPRVPGEWFWHIDLPFTADGAVDVQEWIEEGDVGNRYVSHRLDRAALERGLQLMADKAPGHWANLLSEDEDAETGDAFIQLCVLGEVRYG